jgi:hypothetical protein
MKVGYKMDYGKLAEILAVIYDDGVELSAVEYLPSNYWIECEDSLTLATFVSSGWAEPTDMGKSQLEFAWRVLCEIRGIDPEIMYDSPIEFFKAQAVGAEVIPIEKGKK